jgi:hypothetical protein
MMTPISSMGLARMADPPLIARLIGVYNADGGMRGELSYLAGKLRGTAHCSLCDITHSAVRRKRDWDLLVNRQKLSIELRHRNELPAELRDRTDIFPPAIIAIFSDDTAPISLMGPAELESCLGSVNAFEQALQARLTQFGLHLP